MPARMDKLRLLGDVDNTGRAAGKMLQVDTDDLTHVYVDPSEGGGGGARALPFHFGLPAVATFGSIYSRHGPPAVYDAEGLKTYVAWIGDDFALHVGFYDHLRGIASAPVRVDEPPSGPPFDPHWAPVIDIDLDGYIHIVWGSHNSANRHVRSSDPRDIDSWTTAKNVGSGTYPFLAVGDDGTIYLTYRHSTNHHQGRMQTSTNNGTTWTSATTIVNLSGHPSSHLDFYQSEMTFHDGRLHISWIIAYGSTHDDQRAGLWHAVFDPTDSKMYALDGTDLGATVTWDEHPDCAIIDNQDDVFGNSHVLSGDDIWITYSLLDGGNPIMRLAHHDGTDLALHTLDIPVQRHNVGVPITLDGDTIELFVPEPDGGISYRTSVNEGASFTNHGVIARTFDLDSGSPGPRLRFVRNAGPFKIVAQNPGTDWHGNTWTAEQAAAWRNRIYAVTFAEAPVSPYLEGGDHNHDGTYEPSGTVAAHNANPDAHAGLVPATHRLVVLVDDGASGLEPLTDDDGLWLYGAYPGPEH